MEPVASVVDGIKELAKSSQDFVGGLLHRRRRRGADSTRRNPVRLTFVFIFRLCSRPLPYLFRFHLRMRTRNISQAQRVGSKIETFRSAHIWDCVFAACRIVTVM
uniref:Uncharacterized protein n=1 Tax=Rhizophora mucronata TaxID=61149 RepID=A0A2P2JAV6_RHIMU